MIAATNRVDMLDQALLRPGRFDRRVQVGLPAETGPPRRSCSCTRRGMPHRGPGARSTRLARVTAGFAGADLRTSSTRRRSWPPATAASRSPTADLDEGLLRALAGPRKRDRRIAEGELEIVAWHEAGHALAAELCPTHQKAQRGHDPSPAATPAGSPSTADQDRALTSQQHLHERMVVAMLAGRAAEQIALRPHLLRCRQRPRARDGIAREAVETLGFSPRVGQIVTAGRAASPVSDETRREIDVAVRRLVEDAYEDALRLLADHMDDLNRVAQALLDRKELARDDIVELLPAVVAGEVASLPKTAGARLRAADRPAPRLTVVADGVAPARQPTKRAVKRQVLGRLSGALAALRGADRDAAA